MLVFARARQRRERATDLAIAANGARGEPRDIRRQIKEWQAGG